MSYILDALRRAEEERARERGEVPGINAQPAPAAPPESKRPAADAKLFAAGAAGAVLLLGALAWWGLRPAPKAGEARLAEAARPAMPAPAVPAAAAAAAKPHATQAGAHAPTLLVAPPPVATPRPEPLPAPAVPAAARATGTPAGRAASAPGAPGSGPPAVPFASLSAAQRAELPPMAIGGAIYSEQAASRFIVINGSVIREGENAAPGVVLERIAPKSATLRWRDLRIEMPI